MSDDVSVVDHLREQFARLHVPLDKIDTRLDEVITHIGAVERDIAGLRVDFASHAIRLDTMTRRI
jgi:hypothetical protein